MPKKNTVKYKVTFEFEVPQVDLDEFETTLEEYIEDMSLEDIITAFMIHKYHSEFEIV